jgi:hypothetical protein
LYFFHGKYFPLLSFPLFSLLSFTWLIHLSWWNLILIWWHSPLIPSKTFTCSQCSSCCTPAHLMH